MAFFGAFGLVKGIFTAFGLVKGIFFIAFGLVEGN
jgi:hypothetical protein